MRIVAVAGAVALSIGVLGTAPGVASAQGTVCGTHTVFGSPYELWNYNPSAISCDDAHSVIDRFIAAAQQSSQKYATIDTWVCGINGAAEVEREGGRIADCKGTLGWLTLETP